MQTGKDLLLFQPVQPRLVPVVHLQANKDTDHNNHYFHHDHKPVLVFDTVC
jgi:hypothetical protein